MFGSLGFPELLFIFGLALIIFGPKRLPEVGRAVGRGLAELRKATTDIRRTINAELVDEDLKSADPRKIVRDSLRDMKKSLDEDLEKAEKGAGSGDSSTASTEAEPPTPIAAHGAVARGPKPTGDDEPEPDSEQAAGSSAEDPVESEDVSREDMKREETS